MSITKKVLNKYTNLINVEIIKADPHFLITRAFSVLSFLFIMLFIFFIAYYRESLGDDVLSQFTDALKYYQDGHSSGIGDQIKDFPELFKSVKYFYLNWGGRIVGAALLPLLSLFGQGFTAFFIGICFTYLVFLAGLLIYGNSKELLKHPITIMVLFLFLIYFNPSINYLLMWTFTSIYVVSVLLLATYYYLFQKNLARSNSSFSLLNIILFNILGFIASFNQEVFSITISSLILYLSLKEIVQRKFPIRKIFFHTGLFLGTLLSVSAPGNLIRLVGIHDSSRMARPFIIRLLDVVEKTGFSIFGPNTISVVLITILIVIVIIKITKGASKLKEVFYYIINKNGIDFLFLLYIILISSLPPYMGSYGTLLFIFWCSLVIFKNIYIYRPLVISNFFSSFEKSFSGLFLVILIIGALIIHNQSWMSSMAKTTIERRNIIEQAVIKGIKTVDIPLYGGKCSNRFTFYNYNNYMNGENKTEYYKKYFGVYMNTQKQLE